MTQVSDRSLFKLLILGDTNVGKSSIVGRFAANDPCQLYSTIAFGISFRSIEVDGEKVQLEIWDTAGQERFGTLTSSFYRGAYGAIVVYDITTEKSYDKVRRWLHEIDEHCDKPLPSRVLVGNKCDLSEEMRVVATDDAVEYAKKIGIQQFETSAKDNVNIEAVYT
ncbi:ras-related protein Rab-35-like [Corticium candelabrum]|uniref:ras-related protein Rab-35-like n=1 Tax=Corticium candelabrum TaxID=121492 RepID=UPI002E25DBB8|nr:ras-related protein Rab-35-like [Corticium candelabrum]